MAPEANYTSLEDSMVNDRFWFQWSRRAIDAAITSRNTAAEKLIAGIAWFWTVYTAIAVLGVMLADRDFEWWIQAIIFAPAVALPGTYLLALRALVPVDLAFAREAPEKIEEEYRRVLKEKNTRLNIAYGLTVLAAALVVVAGAVVSNSGPSNQTSFNARIEGAEPGRLHLAGQFPKNQLVVFKVEYVEPFPGARTPSAQSLTAGSNGRLSGAIEGLSQAKGYLVTADWTEKEIRKTITQSATK